MGKKPGIEVSWLLASSQSTPLDIFHYIISLDAQWKIRDGQHDFSKMTILALQLGHNATIALMKDGEIICAVSQEKFDNVKNSSSFPEQAIRCALQESGVQNVDAINDILTNFLHFAKPSGYRMQRGSISELLEQGLKLMQYKIKKQKILVVKDFYDDLPKIVMDENGIIVGIISLFLFLFLLQVTL